MNRQPKGLTLVEVLAGLLIMGTLVSAMLLAHGRYTRQWQRAELRGQAVSSADQLVGAWWRDGHKVPEAADGRMADNAALRWQTQVYANAEIEKLGGRVVRLTVSRETGGASTEEPLLVLDLVVRPDSSTQPAEESDK